MAEITLESIVPFGKYRGRTFAELMADTDYVNWMSSQVGIVERYPDIIKALSHGTTPTEHSCTPEHNRLQMLFLRHDYREGVHNLIVPIVAVTHSALHSRKKEAAKDALNRASGHVNDAKARMEQLLSARESYDPTKASTHYSNVNPSDAKIAEQQQNVEIATRALDAAVATLDGLACKGIPDRNLHTKVSFEKGNWDVVAHMYAKHACPLCDGDAFGHSVNVCVELKPTISEDYPAVLRKVLQRNGCNVDGYRDEHFVKVVIAREFNATSATLTEVKRMFAHSHVLFFTLSEVEAAGNVLPEWLRPKGASK